MPTFHAGVTPEDYPSASPPPLGRLPSAGRFFSQGRSLQAGLGPPPRGPARAEPHLPRSSAAIRRDSRQSPPAPRSGRCNSQGEGFLHCSPTLSSDPGKVPEEEEPLPPTPHLPDAHAFRAHLGRLLTQKGRLSKSWLACSQDLLSLGDPWGGGFPLSRVACDLGRRSTTDFSPKRKALTSPRQGAQNERPASLAARRLGSSERGSLEEAGFRAGPLPAQSRRPRGREGSGPSPHRPDSGRDSVRRAPRSVPRSVPRRRTGPTSSWPPRRAPP